MSKHDVIEAAREVVRAGESEAMAERQADASWMRSAKEVRAIAVARLTEALAAYDASSAGAACTETNASPGGASHR